MAVNRGVLMGSLGVAVVVSLVGGYALSRQSDSAPAANDNITITSNSTFVEPGLAVNKPVQGKRLPTVNLLDGTGTKAVSYTHLTLPTNREV